MSKAKIIAEYVCQWVETAGKLEGRRGQRHLSFALVVGRDGNPRSAYESMVEGIERILSEKPHDYPTP